MEAIAGQSMFGMHKGTQGIQLRLRLTACNKKTQKTLPFDVSNLDLKIVDMDLLHRLCGSY